MTAAAPAPAAPTQPAPQACECGHGAHAHHRRGWGRTVTGCYALVAGPDGLNRVCACTRLPQR